jgi:hypothetical protein
MLVRISLIGLLSLFIFNVNAKNFTLASAINEVRSQGVQIVYSNQYLQAKDYFIEGELQNYSVNKLEKYLQNIKFNLIQVKHNIYIIKPVIETKIYKESAIIIVSVYDADTKKPLSEANVKILSHPSIKAHQSNAIFSIINLTRNDYNLLIEAHNYSPVKLNVNFKNKSFTSKDVYLSKKPKSLEAIQVTTSQFVFKNQDIAGEKILFSEELKQTPHIGNDPSRAVAKLPGLTGNGISAKNYVRGGKFDESVIVLNGLRLNNPYHFNDFFGIFSIIDLSYTEDVALYAGVFPSRYGDFISSVMQINSLKPDKDFFVDSSLSIFNSHLTVGGRFLNDSEYTATFRSGGDLFNTDILSINAGDPKYDDGFISVAHEFDNGIQIQGNVLFSSDEININIIQEDEIADARNQSQNFWVSLKNSRMDNITLNHQVYYKNNQSKRMGSLNDTELTGTLIKSDDASEIGLATDMLVNIDPSISLTIGGQYSQLDSQFDYQLNKHSENFITQLLNQENNLIRNHRQNNSGHKYSLYSNLRYQLNASLFADIGLRYDTQSWINKNQISPRLNVSYFINQTTTFRLGIGRHQQIQSLNGFLFEDEQLSYFEPEVADIIILEASKKFKNKLTLRAEAYYKDYENVQPYYENLFVGLHLNPELFADRIRITPNAARAEGIDITLSKKSANYSWSLGYSFSSIKDIFNDGFQHRSWDQKNGFKFSNDWQLKKWTLSSLLTYHSGWPRTNLASNATDQLVISERNDNRYKDYINLDLRAQYHFNLSKTRSFIWFQLSNALDRKNECCTEYSYELTVNNHLELSHQNKYWLPILPSIGINFYFD